MERIFIRGSLRSLRLGGECGTALSPRRREGLKENTKKTSERPHTAEVRNRRFTRMASAIIGVHLRPSAVSKAEERLPIRNSISAIEEAQCFRARIFS